MNDRYAAALEALTKAKALDHEAQEMRREAARMFANFNDPMLRALAKSSGWSVGTLARLRQLGGRKLA
jgi:hypothetical protein